MTRGESGSYVESVGPIATKRIDHVPGGGRWETDFLLRAYQADRLVRGGFFAQQETDRDRDPRSKGGVPGKSTIMAGRCIRLPLKKEDKFFSGEGNPCE